MDVVQETKDLLESTLQLGDIVDSFDESTVLLGNIPELDSMAVVSLITSIEERFGVVVEDEDITAETFDTVGTLASFIALKLQFQASVASNLQ